MTLIFTDTFQGREQTEFTVNAQTKWHVFNDPIPVAGAGIVSNPNGQIRRNLPLEDQHATLIVGQKWSYRTTGPISSDPVKFMSEGITHVSVQWVYADKKIKVYRGTTAGTLLGESAAVMTVANTFYSIEVKATLHDSIGSVEVHIDNVNVLTLTGIDTRNGGTKAEFDAVEIDFSLQCCGYSGEELKEVYFCNGAGTKNNNFLNSPRIVALIPTGNGASSQGVGSDGNSTDNYLLVDEPLDTGPNAADYVNLAATGDKDTYIFADAPGGIALGNEVYGVMGWSWAQKTDAGARSLVHVARSGANEIDSASATLLNGVYSSVKGAIETKPGGGAWTVTDLNAMEFGIKAGA